ncbi:MAG TPA: phosphodiester glycosidase family protein [Verrucomicrobiae bacterium]
MSKKQKITLAAAPLALTATIMLFTSGSVDSSTPAPRSAARLEATSELNSSNGLSFKRYTVRDVPWSINVVRIDRSKTNFALTTTMGGGTRQGLRTITQQLRTIPKNVGRPVAAVNGDFYQTEGDEYSGDPRGLQIINGELVSSPNDRVSFWIDTNGAPHMQVVKMNFAVTWPKGDQTAFELNEDRGRIPVLFTSAIGRSTKTSNGLEFVLEKAGDAWLPLRPGEKYQARIRDIVEGGNTKLDKDTLVLSFPRLSGGAAQAKVGDVISLSTETTPSLKGVQTGIGGGPALVRDGQAQPARVSKANDRHPRSALGWNDKEFLFVTVDGRQPRLSNGMTLGELADFLAKLNCTEAMNLDGGGSAEVWMEGKVLNSPCYGHERSTANALVLVEKVSGNEN